MIAEKRRILGSVADDFTGATDLAGNWRSTGLRTAVLLGVPPHEFDISMLDEYEALVVAQKIRSVDASMARAAARRAGQFLLDLGCTQIYDKYCSTFDSTPKGNIGPIADELADLTGARRAVVVPSFPDAGRRVYQGYHFVNDELLSESPMRHHPLNPMTDSSIVRLLAAQTERPVGKISLDTVRMGADVLRATLDDRAKEAFYLVIDAIENSDLEVIASATSNDILVTGGSGIALGLEHTGQQLKQVPTVQGHRAILSGSASTMTQRQVQFAKKSLPYLKVNISAVSDDLAGTVADVRDWTLSQWDENSSIPPLIYSVDSPNDVQDARDISADASDQLERFFAALACELASNGMTQLIIAGGETSGSVCEALGIRILSVGESLAPGVSWLHGISEVSDYNLVLKSGNFGDEGLFVNAWSELN